MANNSNNDGRVVINIEDNAAQAARDFQALDNQINKLKESSQKFAKSSGNFDGLEKAYKQLRAHLKDLSTNGLQGTESFKKLAIEAQRLQSQLGATDNSLNKILNTSKSLSAQNTNISSNMNSLTGAARSAGGGFNLMGSSLGSLTKLLPAVSAGFIALKLKDLAMDSIKTAAEFEQLGVSFRVMTGSAQAGQALTDSIIELAAKTPLTTDALAKNAQTMLSFGESAENIIPNLKMLGDIAGGDTQRMQSLTLAFSQVGSQGKLMGQDMLQMVNAGFNPLQVISEKTGKSMSQLKKEMSEGAISFNDVRQAMADATSTGGRFYGLMNEQSKTLNGLLSTNSDTWKQVGNNIGEIFMPAAKDSVRLLNSIGEAARQATGALKEFIQNADYSSYNQQKNIKDELIQRRDIYKEKLAAAQKQNNKGNITFFTNEIERLDASLAKMAPKLEKLKNEQKQLSKTVNNGGGFSSFSGSDGSSKSGREKRQLTISEQIQKAYNDEQRALEDLAAQGITSGKVWDAQVAKVKNLENAVKRIKEATDFGVITPFQGLNKQLQEAQERVMNLAASKVINIEELRKAKGDLTDLQKKMQEVQLAAQTSPYQAKTSQLSMLQSQYLDYAIQGYGNSEQALAIKNQYKTLKLEVERANASLQNSMGISWRNVSSTISSSLSQAITTPLQQGENALERFGNVALNTIQAIAQQMISSGLSKLFQEGAQNGGLLSNILGGNQGTMTGAAAPISAVSDELKTILAQAPQAAASIASIGTSQTAALTAMSGTSGVIASAMSGYASAATAAGQLAASLTQAAIAQAAYSAALVPIAGAVLAPVAATATGAAIGTANILASAGMLASRVTAFADGGIVDKPTYFPMKGSRMGLMGEAGTEAIMPLRRTPDGRLGVEAQVQQPNITIYNQSGASVETVQRPDGDTEIFIRKVNNALRNERTQSGFSSALQRNNSRGVQAS